MPLLVLMVWLFGAVAAFAQDTPDDPLPSIVGDVAVAPVVIDGDRLFAVRGVLSYPAEQRAFEIASRIEALAADPLFDPSSLRLEPRQGMTWIVSRGQRVLAVFDEDAAVEQIDRAILAEAHRLRMIQAIIAYREARTPAQISRSITLALAGTVALIVVGYLGRLLVRLARHSLERRYDARVRDLQIQAFQVVKARQIWQGLNGALNLIWAVTLFVLVMAYLQGVLGLFPWTRGLSYRLFDIMLDPLRTMSLGLIEAVPSLVFVAVLIVVARYVLRIAWLFFQGVGSGTVTINAFEPDWAVPTYRLVRLLVIALTAVIAYPYIPGSQSDAFKGVSLFIGVIFSLGSSSLIGNLIAGYSMTYRSMFKRGDRVKIGSHIGAVERTRLLVTHLRTPKNEEVIVPNSTILNAEVINYSSKAREHGLILHTTVGIGYETPWRQVEAMLIEAANRTDGLLREPPPFVLHTSLGDFAVNYEINVYCDTPEKILAHYTNLHRNILDVFNEYGVQIMTPAYERDPEQPKLVPKAEWYTAPARKPDAVSS